jgi:hypothetical protein
MFTRSNSIKVDRSALEKAVLELLGKQYKKLQITDVEMYDDLDADGEEIIRVNVYFKADAKTASSQSVISAIRYVRNALIHKGKTEFPLLSFISERERNSTVEAH